MPKIQTAEASLIGQPRSGRISPHHPGMVNPYAGAGDLASSMGKSMLNMFNQLAGLAEEGQNLALSQAEADFNASVAKRMDEEVFSLSGVAAAEAGEKARKIYEEERDRQLGILSQYGAAPSRSFSLFADRNAPGQLTRAAAYGRGEVRKANLEANGHALNSQTALYAATGGDEDLATGVELVIEQFYLANGLPKDFDMGANPQVKAALDKKIQNYKDLAGASRIDALLKRGDVEGADLLLESGILSKEAYAAAKVTVDEHANQLIAEVEAGDWLTLNKADYASNNPKSLGGQIVTPEFQRKLLMDLEEQQQKAYKDPTGMEQRKYNKMMTMYHQYITRAREMEALAKEQIIGELSGKTPQDVNYYAPGNESALIEQIKKLPASHIRDALMKDAISRQVKADAKLNETPEAKRLRESSVLEFMRIVSRGGKITVPDPNNPDAPPLATFDLSTEQGLVKAMTHFGFTQREQLRIKASKDDTYPREAVTGILVDLLNDMNGVGPDDTRRFTGAALDYLAPELIDKCTELLQYDVRNAEQLRSTRGKLSREERKEISSRFRRLLQSYAVSEPGKIYGWNPRALPKWLFEGIGETGTTDPERSFAAFDAHAMTIEQAKARENAYRAYLTEVDPANKIPETSTLSSAKRFTGREQDPENSMLYPYNEAGKRAKSRKDAWDQSVRETEKYLNPQLSKTLGIGKR